MSEVLKSHFDENEFKKVESEIDKDQSFKDVYEKIKNTPDYRLNELEERVEKTDETFKQRFDAFRNAVLEAEKKQNGGISGAINNKLTENKEKLLNDLKEKANSKLGGFGGYLFDFAKGFLDSKNDGFFAKLGKIIGYSILGILGLKEGFEQINNLKTEENKQTITDIQKPVENKATEKKEDSTKLEKIDTNKNIDFYYNSGMSMLTYFSGNESNSSKDIYESIRNKKYSELTNLSKENILSAVDLQNNVAVDNFNKTKEVLLSENSRKILKSALTKEKIQVILDKNPEMIGEKNSVEIQKAILEGSFSFKDLTFEQISILLVAGTNTLKLLGKEGISESFGDVKEFIGINSNIDIKGIEQEFVGKRKRLIGDNLWKMFSGEGLNFGGRKYIEKGNGDNSLVQDFEARFKSEEGTDSYNKDKEQLINLIDFKNWLLDGFLNENKSMLKELGYTKEFIESLDYRSVNILYIALAGKKSLDNLSVLDLPFIYAIIGKVINLKYPGKGSGFLGKIGEYFISGDKNNIFDTDEKEALGIIGERLIMSRLGLALDGLKNTLGFTGLFNGDISRSLLTMGAGFGIFKLGKFIPQFRLVGLITGIVGSMSLFTNLYGKSSQIKSELDSVFDFSNSKDDNKLVDIEKYVEKIESIQNKLATKEIEVNGKKEKIVLYSGEKGLEVVYNNSVYRLDVGPEPFDKDLKGDELYDQLPEKLVSATNDNFNGKDIEFSKIKLDGNNIILGEGENTHTIKIDNIMEVLGKNNILHPKKLLSTEEYEAQEYLILEEANNNGSLISYLNNLLPDGVENFVKERFLRRDLVLLKIGEIKDSKLK